MKSLQSIIKSGALGITSLLLIISSTPLAVFADDCTPPPAGQNGVHYPVGADAKTFTYQCDGDYAGQWTNQYYVYNPSTTARTPLYNQAYKYDCDSDSWSKIEWDYSPGDGQYHQSRVASGAPSNNAATNCPVATPSSPAASPSNSNSNSGSGSGSSNAGGSGSISNTGPGSSNSINTNGSNQTGINNATSAQINNALTGDATTGNSMVIGNTNGGSATSGNAADMATIVNLLQSTGNNLNPDNLVTFVANIDGDVTGDLMFDPSAISNTGPGSTNASNTNLENTVKINNSTDEAINNEIDLTAKSGDSTVANNTNAGDATSGSAKTIANVVNMINSAVTSGKSFMGTININGNLNGDILLPPDFIDQLIAANVPTVTITGPSSNNTSNTNASNNTNITNTNNQGITNTIDSKAKSGSANVDSNTTGGSATSGSATTSVTAFNLTGSKVIGANDMLVFVNVAGGKWVGLIVNAPAGATAASLGGGITSTGPNSNNTSNTNLNSDTTVTNTVNQKINNTIKTNAQSGNASVNSNTHGGNAKSGDAESAVNLANVEDSTINLSGWFGILFINVFGTWNGSFGINTSAGDPIAPQTGASNFANVGSLIAPNRAQFASFVPGGVQASGSNGTNTNSSSTNANIGGIGNVNNAVLAASSNAVKAPTPATQSTPGSFNKTAGVISGIALLSIIGDGAYSKRKQLLKK